MKELLSIPIHNGARIDAHVTKVIYQDAARFRMRNSLEFLQRGEPHGMKSLTLIAEEALR